MSKHGMAQANSQGPRKVCFKSISEKTNVDQISYFNVNSKTSTRHIIKKTLTKKYALKHSNNLFIKVDMDWGFSFFVNGYEFFFFLNSN
jgi:hypothetical protein